MTPLDRRGFLRLAARGLAGAGAVLSLPYAMGLAGKRAHAAQLGKAQRVIFWYFPDGVPGWSQQGDASLWHVGGSGSNFTLSNCLEPLGPLASRCVFVNGLTLGPADNGSHPGGAKKLLTGMDGGGGQSVDQHLAATVGADKPHRHVYLGAQANQNGASGDKHISYLGPGQTTPPEDSPIKAFERYFDGAVLPGAPGGRVDPGAATKAKRAKTLVDTALADLDTLRARMGAADKAKLDLHLSALQQVEARVAALDKPLPPPPSLCADPVFDAQGLTSDKLYAPEWFPTVLRLQTDIAIEVLACGLSRVAVVQASHHTSELIMSRFEGTEMYEPGFDMRSHQASHYGAAHDEAKKEFSSFRKQRRWWVSQFRYLLEQLDARPEGDGTMLDHTLVVLCTEVCDGNTHDHGNMPFVLAGAAGGALSTGRVVSYDGWRHSALLTSIANAAGSAVPCFGQDCPGPLPGLLS